MSLYLVRTENTSMKKLLFLVTLFILCTDTICTAQTVEEYVKEGIAYHDSGEYQKAIDTYKKALKIDSKSGLVNYEIAYSYFQMGNHKQAIKYSNKVLAKDTELNLSAINIKGSALDNLGKTKKSIKLFEKALKTEGPHYLLHYNLALNYVKLGELDKAEGSAIEAIKLNPSHASSHFLLSEVNARADKRVPSLLAGHYFLLLEPNSARSELAYDMMERTMSGGVSKTDEKNISIILDGDTGERFHSAEFMLSIMSAASLTEENLQKPEEERFAEITGILFDLVAKGDEEKQGDDIWSRLYIPLYKEIHDSEHMETYCKYITQAKFESSSKWLEENEDKMRLFSAWIQQF